jgi:DNA-binding NarL/FixJ family response regulator
MAGDVKIENNDHKETSIRVLIVDDIDQVRQELATVLTLASRLSPEKIDVVGHARDGAEAIELAHTLLPAVVLMDLEMPRMNGYIATQSIKAAHPAMRVIIFSIHGEDFERQKALQAGADDFIEKGAPIQALVQAIQQTGRGW